MADKDFRGMLESGDLIHCPLLADPISARVAHELGYDAAMVGGGMTAMNGYGLPDGAISLEEIIGEARRARVLSDIPIFLDCDDLGGAPPAVRRHVRMAEGVGAEALLIEDDDCANRYMWNESSKTWTHEFHRLRSLSAAANVIEVAAGSRRNPRTVIVARCNALPANGFDDALERCRAYVASGADAVFIDTLPPDRIAEVGKELGVPMMNMVYAPPSAEEYQDLVDSGLSIALYAGAVADAYPMVREGMRKFAAVFAGESADRAAEALPRHRGAAAAYWSGEGL